MDPLQILPAPTKRKKPYKELTLREKVELIRLAEENSSLSQANIAERYSIAKSNVCRILQRKEEYLQAHKSAKFDGSRKRKLREDCQHHQEEGNETLRAHMLKQHQISRMFMCRCCNWAFPDKTSLHMHMQLQGKNPSSTSSSLDKDSKVIGKSNVSPHQGTLTANSAIPSKNSENSNFGSANSIFDSQNIQMSAPKFPQQFFGASTPNMFNGNGMHAAFLAAAAANANGQGQGQGLFPANLQTEALLNLQQHLQQPQQLDQKSNGLFPQLSMMRNDNVDLLSKLRQRLFLSNMWAAANQQKVQGFQSEPKLPLNFGQQPEQGNDKLLAQFLENNNQLGVVRRETNDGEMSGESEVVETSPTSSNSTSPSSHHHQQQSKNLAQLMQMLHKNALQHSNNNNNDESKHNLMLGDEADSNNNNNSLDVVEKSDENLLIGDEQEAETEMGRLNFVQSPLNNNNNNNQEPKNITLPSSLHELNEEEEDNEDAQSNQSQSVQEQNANLTQKLLEFRQRLSNFVQQEPQLDAAHADFLQNLLKLTY